MNINGKPLTELINELPFGGFSDLVRKCGVDPLWGKHTTNKCYEVTFEYLPKVDAERITVRVEAADEQEAKDEAFDKAEAEVGRWEDAWIKNIKEIA